MKHDEYIQDTIDRRCENEPHKLDNLLRDITAGGPAETAQVASQYEEDGERWDGMS